MNQINKIKFNEKFIFLKILSSKNKNKKVIRNNCMVISIRLEENFSLTIENELFV